MGGGPFIGGDLPPHQGTDWYVDVNGTDDGNGMIDHALTLSKAIDDSLSIQGGDTVWLRGGNYTGDFICKATCTAPNYITYRPFPGEKPVIVGTLTVGDSAHRIGGTIWRNIPCHGTPTDRGDNTIPANDGYLPTNFTVGASRTHFWNCIAYDNGQGFGNWSVAPSSDIYGCLVFNNGWFDVRRGNGHCLYIQNSDETSTKNVKHNIFGPEFGSSVRAYGSDAGGSYNINLTYNVCIEHNKAGWYDFLHPDGASVLMGGEAEYDAIVCNYNHLHGGGINMGYSYHQNGSAECKNNRVYSYYSPVGYTFSKALAIQYFLTLDVQDNVFIGGDYGGAGGEIARFIEADDKTGKSYTWDNNIYHYLGASATPFASEVSLEGWQRTWATWKQDTGFDSTGTYSTSLPLVNEVFVWTNEHKDIYDTRVGIIVIWNWENSATVDVDVTTLDMTIDKEYKIHKALDYFGTIADLTYDGDPITFTMTAGNVAIPVGFSEAICEETLPLFGCWIIEEA